MALERSLIIQLLRLYPIKLLKDFFAETGNRDDTIEIVSQKNQNLIFSFASTYQSTTKQNVYLLQLGRQWNSNTDLLGFPFTIYRQTIDDGVHKYLCLPEVIFSVYLSNPIAKEDLVFLQPIVLEVQGDFAIIRITKLHKNTKSYFPDDRFPKLAGQDFDEENFVEQIRQHFLGSTGYVALDFNKGIKALWQVDDVDCSKIKYRDPHSTSIVIMNELLTFKQQYPERYQEMIHAPIGASTWRFLAEDENLMGSFSCDPTDGIINVNSYNVDTNQLQNVITKILSEN